MSMASTDPSKEHIDLAVDEDIEDAVDDSDDMDEDFASIQRTISQKRREEKEKGNGHENRIQEALPFTFSPNIRPLSVSELQSCAALENAAFTDKEHRASPDKVGHIHILLAAGFLTSHSLSTALWCVRSSALEFSVLLFPTKPKTSIQKPLRRLCRWRRIGQTMQKVCC